MRKISVIIPVFNSQKYLSDLFDCLLKNSFIEGDEVLLVDNGSTDNSTLMCKKMAEQYPTIFKVYCYTDKAGSYAARNYGVGLAEGDILVFTDSDTKPDADWIDTIRNRIDGEIVIAGRIILDITENGLWENFDNIAHLNSEKNAQLSCVATANMAIKKKDFLKVGLFEERFSGGDYEWSMRAAKKGLKVIFIKDAVVHHPTRKTFDQILKKEQRIAYGAGNHYKLNKKSFINLIIIYILKIFKIDTNIKYTKRLKERGMNARQLLLFNCCFMDIRIKQLQYAIKGFRFKDIRSTGVQ